MSQLTPNYNLILIDPTDPFADFYTWYNQTLGIIDANLGGGSGGHTIIDPNDNDMPQENGLQFTGNVTVTDDSVNGKTIIDIPASLGSGHTIINPNGTSMTQRNGLKFTGSVTVSDDSVNDETIVNIAGGGGINYSTTEQVIGTWIDGKPIYQRVMTGLSIGQNAGTSYSIPIPSPDLEQIIDSTLMSTLTQYRTVTHPPTWITNPTHLAIRSQEADTYDTFIIAYTKTTD
ncbi:MAG: hypothetical protein LIR46_01620 [Bacteroidota bacterium]|nr:hypothetical protein [Bacteroidota bacterium]